MKPYRSWNWLNLVAAGLNVGLLTVNLIIQPYSKWVYVNSLFVVLSIVAWIYIHNLERKFR